MIRIAVFMCSLTVIIALTACSTSAQRLIQLTRQDNGSAIEAKVGDRLEVTLEGNPTTGYEWGVGAMDAAILKQTGEAEFKADSGALGAGGKITLRFQAIAIGRTTLRLIYHRPFEADVPPLETFEVTVNVK